MKAPVAIRAPDVKPADVKSQRIKSYIEDAYKRWPFFLPMTEAISQGGGVMML